MKHLCKLMSWAVFLFALTTLVSCSKEQSELSIKDIKGSATILGSLSYSEGQAFSNGQFQELLKPAAGVKVNIKIANASLDPNGTAQGFTTYETTTDGEGNFSIDIPAVENTRVTIQPATFIGKRTLVTEWENNAPVFETEEVVFSINGTEQTVSPGDIIISDDMYGYTTRNFVEGFGETEEISGKIGIGKLYKSNTQRYWDTKQGINVLITVTYNHTEAQSNGQTAYMVRKFGATTDRNGDFSAIIPVKEKGETLQRLTIEPVSFYTDEFKHFDTAGDPEYLEGVYQLGGYYSGIYTNFTFPVIENIKSIVHATMIFTGLNGTYDDRNWSNVTVWDTKEFDEL